MKQRFVFLLVLSIGGLFSSCKNSQKNTKVTTQVISFKKEATLSLFKANTKVLISILDIEISDTDYETQTGLMYRPKMKLKHGMLFIFNDEKQRSFYMKNTQIPLDIIYINSAKKIVSIQENAQPFNETSLPSNFPAKYVLEVNAGLSNKWALKINDSISFNRL